MGNEAHGHVRVRLRPVRHTVLHGLHVPALRVGQSGLTFTRNGVEFRSTATGQFLRWKLNRFRKVHNIDVQTVEEFILKVASGSRTSGRPYAVEIPDVGGHHNLEYVLRNELEVLKSCLEDVAAREVEAEARAAAAAAATVEALEQSMEEELGEGGPSLILG